ncbi:MAG: CoA transferase [Rhodospirillaceae bacterium]
MTDWKGPLDGIRVLDFTRVLSGPYATLLLGDMGAEVIKVETVGKGDDTRHFPPFKEGMSHYFISLNRNKRSVTIDLKTPDGVKLAKDLGARCDVVIENFRPGVMDRLGLGYDMLKADNPKLIYCAISGFGATGPLKDKPSFDIVAQALSGAMSVNREPGQPPTKLGLPMGDLGGGIFGTIAILGALHEVGRTGVGRKIDISMLDGLLGLLGYLPQIYFVTGEAPKPYGTRHPSLLPYGAYATTDGHVIVACLTEDFWHNMARAIGRADLLDDPRFATYDKRLANRDALEDIVVPILKSRTTAEWVERLEEHDVPHAPILDVAEALEHPNTQARGMIGSVAHPEIGDLDVVANPILYDGMGRLPMTPPPDLGADTDAVLSELLDLDANAVAALRQRGVVGG